jgi:hypothetical protein
MLPFVIAPVVVVTASRQRRHEDEVVAPRRRFLLPGVAMAMFAVACHQFFINGFLPTV